MTQAPSFWQCPKCKTPNPWASYLTQCVSCGGPRPAPQAAPIFAPTVATTVVKPAKKRRAIGILSYGYLALVLLVLALVKLLGDRWGPATILMFSPRWVFLFPLPILAIWAGMQRKWRSLAAQGVTLGIVAGPLMGLCVPIGTLFSATPMGETIRVLSLNRGTRDLDTKAFTRLLENGRYDVVCIQEFRRDPVLDEYFSATGWKRNKNGSIWSRFPIVEDLGALPTEDYEIHGAWPVRLSRVVIAVTSGRKVLVANAHMPTMTYAFEGLAKGDLGWFRYYMGWRSRQTDRLIGVLLEAKETPVILAGDFNMPPDSPLMARIRTHYRSGFEAAGWGYGYTRPSRLCWAGIDRILASPECRFVSSRVGPLVGSDHRPIDAEIVLPRSP